MGPETAGSETDFGSCSDVGQARPRRRTRLRSRRERVPGKAGQVRRARAAAEDDAQLRALRGVSFPRIISDRVGVYPNEFSPRAWIILAMRKEPSLIKLLV